MLSNAKPAIPDNTELNGAVRLLPDLPTPDDAFGPHAMLAEAIAELIKTEDGGKAIALEGGWGSGKSSVIEMLRNSLDSEPTSHAAIHVFDAWSHEGDPLRRVFLEDLTNFCSSHFEVKKAEEWSELSRTRLSGRTRETDQTTTPTLRSSWPLVSLAFLTTFPIAVALISGLARQDLNVPSIFSVLLVSLGVAALVPITLVGLFVYCQWWPMWPFTKWPLNLIGPLRTPASDKQKREKAGRWISLYAKKIDETTNTTAHESQGPTSIEFQQYFSELVSEFLKDGQRKLVLVLDNLDRVPPATARTLWTTLRVFAECCENRSNADWANRVWFVVPYDPAAARRLWDDGEEVEVRVSPSDDADKHSTPVAPRLSAAFLDKTFQIRFDVPPLLLADWKSYLSDLLKKALGLIDTDREVVHRVYLLSRRMAEEKRRPPTPRHLKLYVNDIGALYRRFKGRFPVDHLALYAMLRRQGHDVRLWLLENQQEQERYATIMGDSSFLESLCAMAHGTTDVEKARDLHLRSPIEAALGSGDGKELSRLSSALGFWPVLEMLCDDVQMPFGKEESRVLNALKAVEDSGIIEASRVECEALRKFVIELINDVEWKAHSSASGNGIARAVRMNVDIDSIISSMKRLTSIPKAEQSEKLDEGNWIAGMLPIAAAIESKGLSDRFEGAAVLEATGDLSSLLVAIAKLEHKTSRQVAQMIRFSGEIGELVTSISPKPSSEWPEQSFQALRAMLLVPNIKLDFKTILSSVQSRFSSDEELTKKELDRLVAYLRELELSGNSLVESHVKAIVESGVIFRRIHNCSTEINSDTVGHLFRWAIRFHDFGSAPSQPTGAAEGFALAKAIGKKPQEHSEVVSVLVSESKQRVPSDFIGALLVEVDNLQPMVIQVVNRLREENLFGASLQGQNFVSRFQELSKLSNSSELPGIRDLCAELLDSEIFTKSLSGIELNVANLEGVIELVRSGAAVRSKEFAHELEEFLANQPVAAWMKSLETSDTALQLLAAVRSANDQFTLGGYFVEAFEQFLNGILDGSIAVADPPKLWSEATGAISSNQQDTIAGRVIERADAPDKKLVTAIPFFADRLEGAATNHSEESFLRNALIPILRSKNIDSLEWMARVASKSLPSWEAAPEADRETFVQELNGAYKDSDSELQSCLAHVAESMLITLEQEDTSETES